MKTVLFTTHHLKNYAGSEINILELSQAFRLLGYDVEIATFEYDFPIKDEFDKLNINVKNLLEDEIPDNKEYDLIWSQHSPVLNYILVDLNIKASYIIYSSLSTYEPLETPPVYLDEYICRYLGNSKETKESIQEKGIDEGKISIFKNFVLDNFFEHDIKQPNGIEKLLVVSNHIPDELFSAIKIFEKHSIKVDIIGREGEPKLVTPEILLGYDAVITIGKTVQYCMALGIPVYCYDHFGGDGWITPENYKDSEDFNFSGRFSAKRLDPEDLVKEVRGVNSFGYLAKIKTIAQQRYKLTTNLNKLLKEIYKGKKTDLEFSQNSIKTITHMSNLFSYYAKHLSSTRTHVGNYQKMVGDINKNNDILNTQMGNKDRLLSQKEDELKYIRENLNQKNCESRQRGILIEEKNKELNETKSLIQKRNQELSDKNNQLEQNKDQIQQKNNQLEQKNNQIEQKNNQIKQKNDQIEQKNKEITQKKSLIQNITNDLNLTKEELNQKNQLLKNKNIQNENLLSKNRELQKDINLKNENLNQKRIKIERIKDQHQDKLQELNESLSDKQKSINSKNTQIKKLKNELSTMYTSRSWKLTRPLRILKRLFK